ncbi:MAG: GNAT family N-acetyltransferase [Candidatus Woesearchaeota archaeon]
MKIRRYKDEDFEAVYALLEELFDDIDKEQTRKLISKGIVLCEDKIIGFASLHFRTDIQTQGKIAELTELIIKKEWRGKGYGSQLLREAERIAQAEGCLELRFNSNFKRERAHQFYESRGYNKTSYLFWKTIQ